MSKSDRKSPMSSVANIRAAYDNLCERIERDNRATEMHLQALKGQMNAATEGFGEAPKAGVSRMVDRETVK